MRRADRLFRIIQALRGGQLTTASQLAETLEVSQRTIYRDIADLQTSGVPIEGEAGVGYVLSGGFELPPLMFSADEVVALVAGARLIKAWGGAAMARAALRALDKIDAVLPEAARRRAEQVEVHAIANEITPQVRQRIDVLEDAAQARQFVQLHYTDGQGKTSSRSIRPLGLWFWGKVWTLVAWCDLRDDFRMFRLDRIDDLRVLPESFPAEPKKSLQEFYRHMEEECRRQSPPAGPKTSSPPSADRQSDTA